MEVTLNESKAKVIQANAREINVTCHPGPARRDICSSWPVHSAPRAASQAHPFLSLSRSAPSQIFESLFFFHLVQSPHRERTPFGGIILCHRVPFLPPLVLFVSLVSRSLSLQEFEVSIHDPFSTLPSLVDLGEEEKKSLPGGLVTLGSPIIPWTHRPICDHKKTHHTLSTPHHRVFASPRRSQSGFPTKKIASSLLSHRHHQRTRVFSRTCVRSTQDLSPLTPCLPDRSSVEIRLHSSSNLPPKPNPPHDNRPANQSTREDGFRVTRSPYDFCCESTTPNLGDHSLCLFGPIVCFCCRCVQEADRDAVDCGGFPPPRGGWIFRFL